MRIAPYTLAAFCVITCQTAFSQTMKIFSVGSKNNNSFKVLAMQMKGKNMELKLYGDSASVFVAPLRQQVKLKQTGPDRYQHVDSLELTTTTYLLTVQRTDGQLSSITLQMKDVQRSGDIMEGWIIGKPEK